MLVGGLTAAVADRMEVDLDTSTVDLQGGRFFQKGGVSTEALRRAATPQELMRLGAPRSPCAEAASSAAAPTSSS